MNLLSPIVLLLPAFYAAIIAEGIASWKRGDGRVRLLDTLANLVMGTGNMLADLFWVPFAYVIYSAFHAHALFKIPTHEVRSWVLLFFLDDLCFYWFHRASHRIRLLWAAHVAHHSAERMSYSVASRQPWTDGLLVWPFWSPLALLGFHPFAILTMQSLSLCYQFFLHTTYVGPRRAWLEWVLNTPSHHRAHHGRNPEYIDRNYGGVLILWDRLFGTFEPESAPVDYGITTPLGSKNPLVIAFHEYAALARDVVRARSPREVAGRVLGGPEWLPGAPLVAGSVPREPSSGRPRTLGGWLAAAVVLLALPLAVARAAEAYVQDAIAADLAGRGELVSSVRGVFEERGVVHGSPETTVVTRLTQAPSGRVRLETLAPERYRGDVLALSSGTLVLYSRARDSAVRVAGVPRATQEAHRRLVRERVRTQVTDYGFEARPFETVAGRETVPWRATPRTTRPFLSPATTWLDRELAFPLRARLEGPSGEPPYELAFREVSFGETTEAEAAFEVPATATLVSWDLTDAPLELESARRAADFPLLEPGAELGLTRTRIVRARSSWPVQLALLYERGPFVATLTELKDRGFLDADARGWRVRAGAGEASVGFAGEWTLATFSRRGVSCVVFTDLPEAEALELVASLR